MAPLRALPRNGAKVEIKKQKERAWYDKIHLEKKPVFTKKVETGVPYQLDSKTTVFAPPGSDINVLRKKYNL